MKKFAAFALMICLLVIAVAAVLSVTYPEFQAIFGDMLHEAGLRAQLFFETLIAPFRAAFARGM